MKTSHLLNPRSSQNRTAPPGPPAILRPPGLLRASARRLPPGATRELPSATWGFGMSVGENWIGLRENLQESPMILMGKSLWFPVKIFP